MKPIKLSQSEIARAETTPQGRKYTTAVRPQADGSRTAFLVWVDTGEVLSKHNLKEGEAPGEVLRGLLRMMDKMGGSGGKMAASSRFRPTKPVESTAESCEVEDAGPISQEELREYAEVQDTIKPGSMVVWKSGDQKVQGIVKQLVKDGRVAVIRVRHALNVGSGSGSCSPIGAGEDMRVLVSELTPDLEEAVSPKDLLGTCEGLEDDPSALALAKASSDKKLAEITLHRSKRQDCEEVVKAAAQELSRRGISVEDASKLLGEAKKEGGKVDRREEKAIRELWKQPKAILMELAMEQSDGDGSEFEEYDADELAVFLAEAGYRVRNGKVLPPSSGGDLDEFAAESCEDVLEVADSDSKTEENARIIREGLERHKFLHVIMQDDDPGHDVVELLPDGKVKSMGWSSLTDQEVHEKVYSFFGEWWEEVGLYNVAWLKAAAESEEGGVSDGPDAYGGPITKQGLQKESDLYFNGEEEE